MYRLAPLGAKRPDWLKMFYENSMFRSLVYAEEGWSEPGGADRRLGRRTPG